jgi:hypothetical protein
LFPADVNPALRGSMAVAQRSKPTGAMLEKMT